MGGRLRETSAGRRIEKVQQQHAALNPRQRLEQRASDSTQLPPSGYGQPLLPNYLFNIKIKLNSGSQLLRLGAKINFNPKSHLQSKMQNENRQVLYPSCLQQGLDQHYLHLADWFCLHFIPEPTFIRNGLADLNAPSSAAAAD
ncbi:hypothetical protein MJT46_009176 [Ovis ammon polii x Ovis aries]|nr:hypothetical protein MJT46_009176 [Ovis ammon polii x Ovis aries]